MYAKLDAVGRARFPIRDMTLFALSVRHARIKGIFICACETLYGYTASYTVVLRDHLIARRISLLVAFTSRRSIIRRSDRA